MLCSISYNVNLIWNCINDVHFLKCHTFQCSLSWFYVSYRIIQFILYLLNKAVAFECKFCSKLIRYSSCHSPFAFKFAIDSSINFIRTMKVLRGLNTVKQITFDVSHGPQSFHVIKREPKTYIIILMIKHAMLF